jgi:hypothetical protein
MNVQETMNGLVKMSETEATKQLKGMSTDQISSLIYGLGGDVWGNRTRKVKVALGMRAYRRTLAESHGTI